MTPKRIQRQRTKGWRMPEGAIYVGRPSRWGNPFVVGETYMWIRDMTWPIPTWRAPGEYEHGLRVERCPDVAAAIRWYQSWLAQVGIAMPNGHDPADLRGHDLACWCPLDQPCHADVLLELANA